MSSYTKLFHSILDSSVWQEDDRTRLVWITLLAMADKHGEIQASIPGVAKRAGVPLEAAESAIGKLMAPDRYSRTPDHEGRRIAKIDGGWEILNHAKYRFEASIEDCREKAKERQQRRRNGLQKQEGENPTGCDKALRGVTHRDMSRPVTVLPYNAEAEADAEKTPLPPKGGTPAEPGVGAHEVPAGKKRKPRKPKVDLSNDPGFLSFWDAYPKKLSKLDAMNAWAKLMPSNDVARRIISDVEAKRISPDWLKDGGQFIPYPASYLNGRRWEDLFEAPETKEALEAKLLAHRGCPSHVNRSNATPEDLAEYAEMLKRYKALP